MPLGVRHCTKGVPLPTAIRQWRSAQQEFHYPLPPIASGNELKDPHYPLRSLEQQ